MSTAARRRMLPHTTSPERASTMIGRASSIEGSAVIAYLSASKRSGRISRGLSGASRSSPGCIRVVLMAQD